MSQTEKIGQSNDPAYDECFRSMQVSILAREAVAASDLSCFDIQTMWMDDKLAAQNQESFKQWIELYWAPKPPIVATEISTDVAFKTFEHPETFIERPALQPEPARTLAPAHITAALFSVENTV